MAELKGEFFKVALMSLMKANNIKCPICSKYVRFSSSDVHNDNVRYDCTICGEFQITSQAIQYLAQPQVSNDVFKISTYLRERTIAKHPIVTIVTLQDGNPEGAIVGVDDILNAFPKTISERLDRTLKNLYRLSPHPGAVLELTPEEDCPALFAENDNTFDFVLEALKDASWIKIDDFMGDKSNVTLTVHGWSRIAELEREIRGRCSKQVFVAMWFNESLQKAYEEGLAEAIRKAGYEPLRIDLKEHNEKICDIIIAEIRKCRFMVADFTGHKGGVYFEAGYAMGLGIPIIWTCKEDDKNNLHFDTRQYNHIFWKNEPDLYKKLRCRIEATIPTK